MQPLVEMFGRKDAIDFLIYFIVGFCWIAFIPFYKKQVSFPEVSQPLQVFGSVFNNAIENRPQLFAFPDPCIKEIDQFPNVFPIIQFFLHSNFINCSIMITKNRPLLYY